MQKVKKVLFVCTGNICRSSTADGIARYIIDTAGLSHCIEVDSAGTHGYHVGEPPDPRSIKAAQKRGYDLTPLRARQLELADFQQFDLLLAMDRGHLEIMRGMSPEVYHPKIQLFMHYAAGSSRDNEEVPDPYYGGAAGFEGTLDYCEVGVRGLIRHLMAISA